MGIGSGHRGRRMTKVQLEELPTAGREDSRGVSRVYGKHPCFRHRTKTLREYNKSSLKETNSKVLNGTPLY